MESSTDKRRSTAGAIGERLRGRIEVRGWTVKEFLDRLGKDASVSGQTAIYKYVSGKGTTPPPVGFLDDAARVLEVRAAWLVFDEGEITDEQEEFSIEVEIQGKAAEKAALGQGWTKALATALEDELGDRVPPVAHAVVAHHWRRIHNMALSVEGVGPEDILPCLARSIAAPLNEFKIKMTDLARQDRADYVMGVVPAVARAAEFFLRKKEQERHEASFKKQKGEN